MATLRLLLQAVAAAPAPGPGGEAAGGLLLSNASAPPPPVPPDSSYSISLGGSSDQLLQNCANATLPICYNTAISGQNIITG